MYNENEAVKQPEPTTEVIAMDAPNTVPVTRDLQNELAATASAWFAKRQEKKKADKGFNEELGKLEDRMESLIYEIKSGGTQLVMHFGTEEEPAEAEDVADEPADEAEVIEDEQAQEDESPTFEDAV